VSNLERFGDWIATLAVASFMWISSVVAPTADAGSPVASASSSHQNQLHSILSWAQQEDEPPIEQVGEDTDQDVEILDEAATNEDVETLDEAAPPPVEVDTTEDTELLDQGPPVNVEEDVELLDQGSPPATAAEAPAPSTTMTSVPETTSVAPAATTGPVVPEGFGTGNVLVATGTAEFPVGLKDCHVGAVTGRAYVGIDCGEGDGSSFVGHAPSFQDFPFVLDQSFPFDRESVFASPGTGELDDNIQTSVSAARGAPFDDNAAAPVIRTSGASSVEFEQRAQGRNPRVESENDRQKRGNESRRGGNGNVTSSESQVGGDRSSANSNHQKKKHGNDNNRSGSAKDNGKKSKSSKHAKNRGGKKGKKSQSSK